MDQNNVEVAAPRRSDRDDLELALGPAHGSVAELLAKVLGERVRVARRQRVRLVDGAVLRVAPAEATTQCIFFWFFV